MRVSSLLGIAILAVSALAATTKQPSHPDRIGVEIQISPLEVPSDGSPQAKAQYMITAVIRQLETGEVLFAPKVQALAGTSAAVSGEDESDTRFKASFLVDGSSAKYTVEATRSDQQLLSSRGTIQLSR